MDASMKTFMDPGQHLDLGVGEPHVLPHEQLRAAHQRQACKTRTDRKHA